MLLLYSIQLPTAICAIASQLVRSHNLQNMPEFDTKGIHSN
ncbi:hypothetical protein [Nostoc sp. MG11]|nr:hypothetical protein [Nostoc sp. MG11]